MKLKVFDLSDEKHTLKDQNFNFDRVMKLTFYGLDKNAPSAVTYEFAPLSDERKTPRLEAVINDIVHGNKIANRPGYTAEITVYNPGDSLSTILAYNTKFTQDYVEKDTQNWQKQLAGNQKQANEVLEKYYRNRIRVKVECGYWNHEGGFADYKTMFDGYINSYVNYLKGNDMIAKFYCHDYDASALDKQTFVKSLGGEIDKKALESDMEKQIQDSIQKSGKGKTWHMMFGNLVRLYQEIKPKKQTIEETFSLAPGTLIQQNPEMSTGIMEPVTEDDRNNTDWFTILYVMGPNKKDKPDYILENRLSRMDVSSFTTSASFLENMLNDLVCYQNADVEWEVDYEYTPGRVTFFVWPTGEGNRTVTAGSADIRIVNYQNVLESPTVSSNGSLQIKMFLNPECIPGKSIGLFLDRGIGAETTTGDALVVQAGAGLNEVLAPGGNISPYAGAQILGAKTSAVYTLNQADEFATNNGYMFNLGFPIIQAKHEVSTHGKEWYTTVKTIPCYSGLNLKRRATKS